MKTAVPCYYHLDVEVSPERVGQVRRILAAHLRLWDLETLVEPVCRGAVHLRFATATRGISRESGHVADRFCNRHNI